MARPEATASAPAPGAPSVAVSSPASWGETVDILLANALGQDAASTSASGGNASDNGAMGRGAMGTAQAGTPVDSALARAQRLPGLVAGNRVMDAESAERSLAVLAALDERLARDETFRRLVRGARLSQPEYQLLAIAAAVEVDLDRQAVVAALNGRPSEIWLTPAVLARLAPSPVAEGWQRAVGPGSGLRRAGLLVESPADSWASTRVRLHPEIVWWLSARQFAAAGLPAGARILGVAGGGDQRLVIVTGADRIRRLQAATDALAAEGFLVTPNPGDAPEWQSVMRRAACGNLAVVLELDAGLSAADAALIDAADHVAWAISSRDELPLSSLPSRAWTQVPARGPRATPGEVHGLLGPDAALPVGVTAEQLHALATLLPGLDGDLPAAVRRLAVGGIDQLAERLHPSRSWDDLVLPGHVVELLEEIVVRARHQDLVLDDWGFDQGRATGVLALFAGPSGTGKTMAAEVIAHQLGVDLYRVDLSRVVDKYVGETEKRLSALLDTAETIPAVLLFDEADALVGKRTEVSSAHDRHANVEVAFLLQRLERHTGVVVLATNLMSNIDAAFLRRIHVSVQFTAPGPAERLLLWERSIPTALQGPDVDLSLLAARLEITGAQIRNIAVRAGFLAAGAAAASAAAASGAPAGGGPASGAPASGAPASGAPAGGGSASGGLSGGGPASGAPVTMELLIASAVREMRSAGRVLKPEELLGAPRFPARSTRP